MNKHLHIISLDVPWPANYGGVIDIYYKIFHLSQLGIKIHLHCFTNGRGPQEKLHQLCTSVQYYPRKKYLKALSVSIPYIVQSRSSQRLIQHLKADDYPILMEGIHCSFLLSDPAFADRKLLLRLHNIEHIYYERLAQNEQQIFRKKYFMAEGARLEKYEKMIANKAKLLAISQSDAAYFKSQFAARDVELLPAFTPWNKLTASIGKSDYCLYHGNLSVNENENAAIGLIENIFKKTNIPFRIAGKDPSKKLQDIISGYAHIQLLPNPSDEELQTLIHDAHINIIPSLNSTGIKLKLLNALYNGRHCVVNTAAVSGSGLESVCRIADTHEAMLQMVQSTMLQDFTAAEITQRAQLLDLLYNNQQHAALLKSWL